MPSCVDASNCPSRSGAGLGLLRRLDRHPHRRRALPDNADGGSRDIFIVTSDGLTRVPLTTTPRSDFAPDWQPLPICTIGGTSAPDVLAGTDTNDVICGRGGDDAIDGGSGNDLLIGGPGNDTVGGGDGNDMLDGGPGNDALSGGPGLDSLNGGPGTDACSVDDGGGFTFRCP